MTCSTQKSRKTYVHVISKQKQTREDGQQCLEGLATTTLTFLHMCACACVQVCSCIFHWWLCNFIPMVDVYIYWNTAGFLSLLFQGTQISALPREVLRLILRWVVSSQMNMRDLEQFSMVRVAIALPFSYVCVYVSAIHAHVQCIFNAIIYYMYANLPAKSQWQRYSYFYSQLYLQVHVCMLLFHYHTWLCIIFWCILHVTVCSGVQRVLLSGQGARDLENCLSKVCAILVWHILLECACCCDPSACAEYI